MKISALGRQFIKVEEGLRLSVYKDIVGKATIGYGHLIKKGETFSSISVEEAEELFDKDCAPIEVFLSTLILTQEQFDALGDFCFNLGVHALQASTLLNRVKEQDYPAIEHEFKRWCYADGKPNDALRARREREVDIYMKGKYKV